MAKPESIKIEPWADFPKQSYSIFTDDFPHDKLYTLKVNSKGDKSTVNVKANVANDNGKLSIADQVKFWFSLPGSRSIYSKIKSSNYLKLHYDNGIVQQWNQKWNLYASLNGNKNLENISVRVGAATKSQHCHSDNRLKVELGKENIQNWTWYNRTIVNHKDFTFGLMAAYGITNNVLVKNNLLFGYKINDSNQVFLRVENNGYRKGEFNWLNFKEYFDNVKVDFVSKHNNSIKYGFEGVFSRKAKNYFEEGLIVLEHVNAEKKWTTKAKLSSKLDVALSWKYPSFLFKDIATCTIGLNGSKLADAKRQFKAGLQVEFNV